MARPVPRDLPGARDRARPPRCPAPARRSRPSRRLGGRAIVVTAKHEPNAKLHLAHLGIEPDAVIGWLWAEAKAEALREHGASVYVGDHIGDVRGAAHRRARCRSPCRPARATRTELRAAGADVVLDDLTAFPAWLRGYRRPSGAEPPAPPAPRRPPALRRDRPQHPGRRRSGSRRPSACTPRTRTAGTASVPRNSGATVTSVATAPTMKTMRADTDQPVTGPAGSDGLVSHPTRVVPCAKEPTRRRLVTGPWTISLGGGGSDDPL